MSPYDHRTNLRGSRHKMDLLGFYFVTKVISSRCRHRASLVRETMSGLLFCCYFSVHPRHRAQLLFRQPETKGYLLQLASAAEKSSVGGDLAALKERKVRLGRTHSARHRPIDFVTRLHSSRLRSANCLSREQIANHPETATSPWVCADPKMRSTHAPSPLLARIHSHSLTCDQRQRNSSSMCGVASKASTRKSFTLFILVKSLVPSRTYINPF